MTPAAQLEALADGQRRALYALLLREGPSTRKSLAEALDIGVSLVSFHLDKLMAAGLVRTAPPVASGRRGRPATWYEAATTEAPLSVPPRRYDLAAELLAEAAGEADAATGFLNALRRVARDRGRQMGSSASRDQSGRANGLTRLLDLLVSVGYEPDVRGREVVFVNCPFDRLRRTDTELVCTMNLEFARGCVEGLGVGGSFEPRLQPGPSTCCVAVGRTLRRREG